MPINSIITDTDYRISRHLRKNYSGQKRVFLSMEIKNCNCWIYNLVKFRSMGLLRRTL